MDDCWAKSQHPASSIQPTSCASGCRHDRCNLLLFVGAKQIITTFSLSFYTFLSFHLSFYILYQNSTWKWQLITECPMQFNSKCLVINRVNFIGNQKERKNQIDTSKPSSIIQFQSQRSISFDSIICIDYLFTYSQSFDQFVTLKPTFWGSL